MILTTEQKQAIDEQVKIDMMLGVISKGSGPKFPNSHYDYIMQNIGFKMLNTHLDIFDPTYMYIRDLIWEDDFGCFK